MDLCHSIIAMPNDTVRHAVISLPVIEKQYQILSGPHMMSHLSCPLVALCESPLHHWFEHKAIDWGWSLLITDDVAQKPLLANQSESRAIFWLGELIQGIALSFEELGFQLKSLKPSIETGLMVIDFSREKSSQTFGAFLCLATAIDALLFARGLLIKSSELYLKGHNQAVSETFLYSLKTMFEQNYDTYRSLA